MAERPQFDESRPKWRNFPADVEDLARDWVLRPTTVEPWQDHGEWAATESKPRLVYSARLGLYGIAKPGISKEDGVARAAHEKIAADLAYYLDLPVPPAVLWDRSNGRDVHSQTVISAWAFPQPHSWAEARHVLSERELAFATRCMSAMRAFDAWIYATDRKLENVLVTRDGGPGAIRMAFVDYAFSLTHTWEEIAEDAGGTDRYCDPECDAAKTHTIARIEAFDEDLLDRQLARIPEAFLPRDEKRRIKRKLVERKTHLRELLEVGPAPTA